MWHPPDICPVCNRDMRDPKDDSYSLTFCRHCKASLEFGYADSLLSKDDLDYIEAIVMGETPSPALSVLTERLRIRNRALTLYACRVHYRHMEIVASRYGNVCEACQPKVGTTIPIRPGVLQALPPFDDCQSPHQLCLSVRGYAISEIEDDMLENYLRRTSVYSDELLAILTGQFTAEDAHRLSARLRQSSIETLRSAAADADKQVWIIPSGDPTACNECLDRIGQTIMVGPGAGRNLPPYLTCKSPHNACLIVTTFEPGSDNDGVSFLRYTSWHPSPIRPDANGKWPNISQIKSNELQEEDDFEKELNELINGPSEPPAPLIEPHIDSLPQSREEWPGLLFVIVVFAGMLLFLLRALQP